MAVRGDMGTRGEGIVNVCFVLRALRSPRALSVASRAFRATVRTQD